MPQETPDIDSLLDAAIGIGPDGAVVSADEQFAARRTLTSSHKFSDQALDAYKTQRLAELIRDDTGRARGCSFPHCQRNAVWERVFEKSGSAMLMVGLVGVTGAATFAALGRGMFVLPGASNFEQLRLGSYRESGRVFVQQWGCWRHIGGFVVFPSGGTYSYHVVSAKLPDKAPHPLFEISDVAWEKLKIVEDAQNLGAPEGPRGFCGTCGLPHDPQTGKGIISGEGDDFWRTFCEYCDGEIKPDES